MLLDGKYHNTESLRKEFKLNCQELKIELSMKAYIISDYLISSIE
ncbi:hypothetical protein CNEO4_1210005 [Clostridium neonatale]|nr:hypothetical protein CNEO3_140070 [Clostridium neonatale]CAI3578189.1 hypothetical protein CNEO4_1210005 [Clostridium neonatale]CAI3596533.1 hypothetical protein CNEO3_160081 [Clostridium neonatale]CAI3597843.1 hypothetical protein CNEO3_160078 [Clostridium neonatale]CAI3714442.1 hypothetical protein CNEO4_890028 [Clostridium neonatale]